MSETDEELDAIRNQKRDQLQNAPKADEPVYAEGAEHFESLTSDGVVLVDFYADWCGPCKMLEPTVKELAAETDARVVKVDIDAHQLIAQQYGIRGVPTVYLFADGEPVQQWVGVRDKNTYQSAIEQHA